MVTTPSAMVPLRLVLLASVSWFHVASPSLVLTIADYTVSIIQYLSTDVEVGIPKIVFIDLANRMNLSEDDGLLRVIPDPQISNVSRMVLSCDLQWNRIKELPLKVTLLLLQGDPEACSEKLRSSLRKFDPSTRVLVISTGVEKQQFKMILGDLNFYLVFYVDFSQGISDFKALFGRTPFRNLGRNIKATARMGSVFTYMAIKWVKETARMMNTSLDYLDHGCYSSNITLNDDCFMLFSKDNKVDIEAEPYILHKIINNRLTHMPTMLTSNVALLVPRFQLNIIEFFVLPFDWKVWVILLTLFTTLEIVNLLFPSAFHNDPLLLSICGFERYDLNKTKHVEKIVLFALIVLMFFMTCAYETKLISMITSPPTSRDIRTVQDLIQSKVRIKANLLMNLIFDQYPSIADKLVNSTDTIIHMDGFHAYPAPGRFAEMVLPNYYDHEQKLQRYGILDQSFFMTVYGFLLAYRSPLEEAFQHTLAMVFEAGLWDLWTEESFHRFKKQSNIAQVEPDQILHFVNLIPALLALGVGMTAGGTIFVGELAVAVAMKIVKKRYDGKTLEKLVKDMMKNNKLTLNVFSNK